MTAPLVFGLLGVGVVGLALRGWLMLRTTSGLPADAFEGPEVPRRRRGLLGPLLHLVGRRTGPYYLRMMPAWHREETRKRILAAGRPDGLDLPTYAERKASQLVLFGSAALLSLSFGGWITAVLFLGFGLIGEDIRLSRLSRLRREEIDRSLPDFLDVLAVVVSAGLSFRQGLGRVAELMGGALGDEVQATLRQLDLGVSRRDAFLDLRDRTGSERLKQFVTALLQAEELGAPLADTLIELSGGQRRQASQDARRKAARASPRVSLVVSMVIVPGAMILIATALFYGTGLAEHGLFPQ